MPCLYAYGSGSRVAPMEIGLYTFGELTPHWADGRRIGAEQRLKEVLAAAKLADEAGFAVFALGEHHRLDFSIAATPVVLAAIAQVTARIRLASAVTILPTADPVNAFEDFATVDLLSGGRVEVIAGRGVFTESFPLFGYDLADQDELFAEKLDLLLRVNAADRVAWHGHFRPALHDAPCRARPAPSGAASTGDLGRDRRNAGQRGEGGGARVAAGAGEYRTAAGAIGAAGRSLPAHRRRSGPWHGGPQGRRRQPPARAKELARRDEHVLSLLRRLFPQPRARPVSRARDFPRRLRAAREPRRRAVRREPAADRGQDPPWLRAVPASALHGADRHRRLALSEGR